MNKSLKPSLLVFSVLFSVCGLGANCHPQPTEQPTHGFRVSQDSLDAMLATSSQIDDTIVEIKSTRATIPAAEQMGWGFDLLSFVTDGSARAMSKMINDMALADGDIEAMAFIVLMQATNDMEQDLKTIMDEVKAATATKQKLRDLLSKVNKDVATNAGQQHDGYNDGTHVGGVSHIDQSGGLLFVAAGEPAHHPIDLNQGGVVQTQVDCDFSSAGTSTTGRGIKAELINLISGAAVAQKSANAGVIDLSAELPRGQAVPIVLRLTSLNLDAAALLTCKLVINAESGRQLKLRPIDAKNEQVFFSKVALVKTSMTDLQFAIQHNLAAQPALEDRKFLLGLLARTARSFNRLSPFLGLKKLTYEEALKLRQDLEDAKDSISEMSEQDMLMLQQLMDKKDQLESMISNVMKAGYEAGQAAIQALKAS